jgi:hypothetical protein
MDTQQMMEILLARMDANSKTMNARMDAKTKATLVTLEMTNEIKKAMQDKRMKANIDACIADIKNDRKETMDCQDAMEANLEKMEPNPGEKEAGVERQETPNEDVAIYSLRKYRKETMACQGTTEARLESELEHQEIPNEDAVVKPVRGRKKRHRGRKQAAGRRGELKELTRGDCGSQKKLAAACRKVSRRATVAWCKRNVFRNSWTNRNCEPRKEVTTAGRKITRCAGQKRKVQNKDDVSPKSPKGGTYEKRLWRSPECKKGIKSRDIEEPLHLRKGRKTANSNRG